MRSIQTQALDALARRSLHHDPEELRWLLDHGAKLDKDAIMITTNTFAGSPASVSPAVIAVLIQHEGIQAFAGTRLLQQASRYGQTEVVKMLLDAGADPNEEVPAPAHDWREGSTLALRGAIIGRHPEIVWLLLVHGARADSVAGDGGRGAVDLARRVGGRAVVRLLEDHVGVKSKM
ncbi:hypothetical protein LTR85_003931 [Meristemomyces frigidus]|nr:hypothetical protein LTR85_003931 [Meristemomyces frigidus]